jgi:hypothetical protein
VKAFVQEALPVHPQQAARMLARASFRLCGIELD